MENVIVEKNKILQWKSPMVGQNTQVSRIKEGDIISFLEAVNAPLRGVQYGIVIAIAYSEREVKGFEILPFTPHNYDEFLENDSHHYMYSKSARNILDEMGLSNVSPNKNWRLHYTPLYVPNTPQALGKSRGAIQKIGSISNTTAYDAILNWAEKIDLKRTAIIGLADITAPQRLRTSGTLRRIIELGGHESGKNAAHEREKQKLEGLDRLDPDAISRPKRKYTFKGPKNNTGKSLNISLEDALRLNLVTREVKEILLSVPKGRQKPITTLREAYDLACKAPEKLAAFLHAENDLPLREAFKKGLLGFDTETPALEKELFTKLNSGLAPEGRKNAIMTFQQLCEMFFRNPETVLNLFENEEHKEIVLNGILESYGSIAIEDGKITLEALEKKIIESWKKFISENPLTNPKYSDYDTMLPVPRP